MNDRLRQRRGTVALATVLVIVGAGAWVFLRPRASELREGSEVISGISVRVASKSLRSFRITYRVESYSGNDTATSTDEILVRRPFDARVVNRAQGRVIGDTINTFLRYSLRGQTFSVQPGPPEPDRRPGAFLDEAVRDGYALAREHRRVANRVCRVYRLGDSSDSTALPKVAAAADTYTDVCMDEAGLILEELTFLDGELSTRRLVTEIDEAPDIARDEFDVPEPDGDPRQIGSVQELEPDSKLPGDPYFELARQPKGFEQMGRYAVVPPGQPGFTDLAARGSVITFASEVWSNGTDVVVIDQGATRGTRPFDLEKGSRRVKVEALGTGEVRYSLRENEIRFLTGGVRFLRVRGTVSPSRLLAIARSLEKVPGGPLRPKD